MTDVPYPTYDLFQKITPEQMAYAPLLSFGPLLISGTKWEAVAAAHDSGAYASGFYKVYLTKGYSYDVSTSSFFQPYNLVIYDQFANAVALGSDNLYSTSDEVWGFFAPYTGVYYIDAGWHKGAYYTSASLSVYEDQNPVKVNHAPVVSGGFVQTSWTEGVQGRYPLPTGTFKDADGDALTYSATDILGAPLPSWLTFNATTLTLVGTPPRGVNDLAVTITARDPGGLTAKATVSIATPAGAAPVPDTTVAIAAANILRAPATDPLVVGMANQVTLGILTSQAAIAKIVALADATTSVATLSYQFFTGKIPGEPGIIYLVSANGPNPNNLNAGYYQTFNLENRYINFAMNLGKVGEGRAQFEADYGALTLEQATKKAYGVIFGSQPTDAKVTALLSGGRDAYFESYGHDGHNGIGAKAAMVGWLLAEAEKADLGTYAHSNAAFLTDIADGGAWAVDLVGVYGRPEFPYLG